MFSVSTVCHGITELLWIDSFIIAEHNYLLYSYTVKRGNSRHFSTLCFNWSRFWNEWIVHFDTSSPRLGISLIRFDIFYSFWFLVIPVDFSSYLFISFFDIPGMLTARDAIDYSIFQRFCLKKYSHCFSFVLILTGEFDYSPFCVQANIIKLVVCMYVCMYVIRVAVTFATRELHVCEWEGFI
jgi:hypothetical protein